MEKKIKETNIFQEKFKSHFLLNFKTFYSFYANVENECCFFFQQNLKPMRWPENNVTKQLTSIPHQIMATCLTSWIKVLIALFNNKPALSFSFFFLERNFSSFDFIKDPTKKCNDSKK